MRTEDSAELDSAHLVHNSFPCSYRTAYALLFERASLVASSASDPSLLAWAALALPLPLLVALAAFALVVGLRSVESLLLAQVLLLPLPVLFGTHSFFAFAEHYALPWVALLVWRTSLLDALLLLSCALVTLLLVHLLSAQCQRRLGLPLPSHVRLAALIVVVAAFSPALAAELLVAALFYLLAQDAHSASSPPFTAYPAWVLALAALVFLSPLSGYLVRVVGVPVTLLRLLAVTPTLAFVAFEALAHFTRA